MARCGMKREPATATDPYAEVALHQMMLDMCCSRQQVQAEEMIPLYTGGGKGPATRHLACFARSRKPAYRSRQADS